MSEIAPKYDVEHIRIWMNQKPPKKWGRTVEGFPLHSQAFLSQNDARVFPYIGMVDNVIIPINQEGVKPGKVRVIFLDVVSSKPTIFQRIYDLIGPLIYH